MPPPIDFIPAVGMFPAIGFTICIYVGVRMAQLAHDPDEPLEMRLLGGAGGVLTAYFALSIIAAAQQITRALELLAG